MFGIETSLSNTTGVLATSDMLSQSIRLTSKRDEAENGGIFLLLLRHPARKHIQYSSEKLR